MSLIQNTSSTLNNPSIHDTLKKISDPVSHGIIFFDHNENIHYCNDEAARLLKEDKDALIGKSSAAIFKNFSLSLLSCKIITKVVKESQIDLSIIPFKVDHKDLFIGFIQPSSPEPKPYIDYFYTVAELLSQQAKCTTIQVLKEHCLDFIDLDALDTFKTKHSIVLQNAEKLMMPCSIALSVSHDLCMIKVYQFVLENFLSLKRKERDSDSESPALKRIRTVESFKLNHEKKPIDLKTCRILIVEDSKFLRSMLTSKLKRIGFAEENIKMAEDGQIGVDEFKKSHFDVVFMDIEMPNMDGFEASNQIRLIENELKKTTNVPIISITSTTEAVRKDKIHLNKISTFLKKETSAETILNTLKEYFELS